MRFLSHAIHGQTAPWKRPQGRAAAPERGRFVGIGEPSPTSKRGGVYRRALLASFVRPIFRL